VEVSAECADPNKSPLYCTSASTAVPFQYAVTFGQILLARSTIPSGTKIDTQFSLCLIKHPAMNSNGGMEASRSQLLRGLRNEPSSPARTLESWVQIPLEA
jgi:hypothetical protein